MSPDALALSARTVTKRYGSTVALNGASLDVPRGEIHGLVGHNGSGKSTFVKILTGVVNRDHGEIVVGGEPAGDAPTPSWWSAHGVSVVHQDLGLVPSLTVWENLLAGRMPSGRFGFVRPSALRAQASEELEELGSPIEPDALVADLSDAERAELAIVRAVMTQRRTDGPGLLILDEPTTYLPLAGTQRLFDVMRDVVRKGGAVIFISHKLGEVLTVCDRVTVLRDGTVTGSERSRHLTQDSLVEMMLGGAAKPVERTPPSRTTRHEHISVRGLRSRRLGDVSVGFGAGEIVGVTGLTGSVTTRCRTRCSVRFEGPPAC